MPKGLPKFLLKFLAPVLAGYFIFFLIGGKVPTSGEESYTPIYNDSLQQGWSDWSWGASINFENPAPVQGGTKSMWASLDAWGAIFLHSDAPVDIKSYQSLSFYFHPQSDNYKMKLIVYDFNNNVVKAIDVVTYSGPLKAGQYTQVKIPITDLGTTSIHGLAFQEASGETGKTLFIDEIQFISLINNTLPATLSSDTLINESRIFQDSLDERWNNWSWNGRLENIEDLPERGNTARFTTDSGWAGLYLHNESGVNAVNLPNISFNLKPESNDQKIRLVLYDSENRPIGDFKPVTNWVKDLRGGSWHTVNIPVSELGASGKVIKGVAFQEASGLTGKSFGLDDIIFTNTIIEPSILPTAMPLQQDTPTPTIVPKAVVQSGKYNVNSGNVFKNGSKIVLRGVNWFGAETETFTPHGLWARDYKDMVKQMKNLGFNAVRLPVCPQTLRNVPTNSIDYSRNTDLKGLNSLEVLDKVVNELNSSGVYILLDHHRPDCKEISELWYTSDYSEENWINDLELMAKRYKGLENFIGIDLKNEPHGRATWGTGNTSTDWNLAAEKAGKRVLSTNPDLLIFVEGIGENPTCSSNIGHGWGSNLEGVNCKPIAEEFIPSNKLVYSPHSYGPEIYFHSYFAEPGYPDNMPQIWEKHFGFLTGSGKTVILGEWGGKYGTTGGNINERQYLDKLAAWLASKKMCNSFYWSFNPNSSDTGGILKDDWNSVWTDKVNFLNSFYSSCQS